MVNSYYVHLNKSLYALVSVVTTTSNVKSACSAWVIDAVLFTSQSSLRDACVFSICHST